MKITTLKYLLISKSFKFYFIHKSLLIDGINA